MKSESACAPFRPIPLLLLFLGLVSCGGGGSGGEPGARPPSVVMFLTQDNLPVATGESVLVAQFFAIGASPGVSTAINWSVREGAAGGSITSAGLYTAPSIIGSYHVVATSQADPAVSRTMTLLVGDPVVTMTPEEDTLGPGGVRTFSASIYAFDTRIHWSVLEGASGGTMDGSRYTAPATPGTYHVVASSAMNPAVTSTAEITVVASGFRPAADMINPRIAHTATLLQDGRVLVAGGNLCDWDTDWDSCWTPAAEIFDPATGLFAATGAMLAPHGGHVATLLPDARVLFLGGRRDAAELYDPATGSFTATAEPAIVQSVQTATLLANGTVLVTGRNAAAGSATRGVGEIYHPATGTYTPAGSDMAIARGMHTATRLLDGRVLIAGGATGAAELFDPATGLFSPTGNMKKLRSGHTATLMGDGRVLISGGWDLGEALTSAEIYDPATGEFSMTGVMMTERDGHSAQLLPDGRVLISGGWGGGGWTAEVFDPATGTFSRTGSMATARLWSAMLPLADGRVLVVGGGFGQDAETYR